MQVGIWIRVSTEDQARGESPKNHEHRARMYAELKGWNVVELYDLSGVSGKTVLDHPEAKRMLTDVASGRIKALIFSKLARLARNVRELLDISDRFQQYNANLVSLEESIDTSTPAGRLLFTVIGALAQWEREEISARVSASVPVRARQGKPTGGKGPFGYMWIDKKLVINPAEAPVVKEMFNTFLETRALLPTARIMNEKGYRTRNGAKFGKTTTKRILTDPTYKGTKRANYSRSKGNKKSWALKPEKDWVFFEVEPLIAEETWNEVNAIIKQNAMPFPAMPPQIGKYAFSGLVMCGECNQKMYVMKYNGMKIPRYICRGCKAKINEDILLEQFKEGLKCIVVSPEQLQGLQETDESVIQAKENQLKTLKSELKAIIKKIDNLLDLVNDGSLDRKIFSERIRELQKHKQQLESEIPRLEGEIDFLKVSEIGKDYLLSQAQTLYALWDTLDDMHKTKLVRELTSRITVKKDELIFEYFYLPELMELCKSDQTHAHADTLETQDINAHAPLA
jgi:site-specific DNA recombinase